MTNSVENFLKIPFQPLRGKVVVELLEVCVEDILPRAVQMYQGVTEVKKDGLKQRYHESAACKE